MSKNTKLLEFFSYHNGHRHRLVWAKEKGKYMLSADHCYTYTYMLLSMYITYFLEHKIHKLFFDIF